MRSSSCLDGELPQRAKTVRAEGHRAIEVPPVDAGEGDVLPLQGREVPQVLLGNLFSLCAKRRDYAFEVDRILEAYSRR